MATDWKSWEQYWRHCVEGARARPELWIGSRKTGHVDALEEPVRLLLEAGVFQPPITATVQLSPTEYLVRGMGGPVIPLVQQAFPWNTEYLLWAGWDWRTMLDQLDSNIWLSLKESFHECNKEVISGLWLDSSTHPAVLARHFVFAIRTDEGLWCQALRGGWPVQEPFLLKESSPVCLLVAAKLDPHWFTGLPFTIEDLGELSSRYNISTEWRPDDDLLDDTTLTPEGVRRLL